MSTQPNAPIPPGLLPALLKACREIARMNHPSIEHLLRHQGFGFEADRVAELVAAVEALPEAVALPITSPPSRPPAFLCALLAHRRGDHGA